MLGIAPKLLERLPFSPEANLSTVTAHRMGRGTVRDVT